ncbi:helix-hairpin-helix domain-containing protein [Alkalihalobacillus hwajinpoensis]|uniref:helix-hairpin-helix domain-containing protein n=1 Tax=Guptibacillus hwajinpoensis TaxID=208199 RepID=UPI0018840A15|nr:helix-hairpin-helix domain-containing protein [Pseudalkalibacillus hwajinpoensis]MBF0706481.1 helix-hairpin-helix domain-containing protein [Pseudalkalibacillus hwajinpoensis]
MKYFRNLTVREKVILSILAVSVGISFLLYFNVFAENQDNLTFDHALLENEGGELQDTKETVVEKPDDVVSVVLVDVKGAVVAPGVYEINSNGRVKDVIKKAGGFLEDADQVQLNLASKVVDEMVIYVPIVGEVTSSSVSEKPSVESQLVSINSADLNELQELPGIGPAKAEAIVQFREDNGGFTAIEELMNISGIGEKTFEKLKDLITVQ